MRWKVVCARSRLALAAAVAFSSSGMALSTSAPPASARRRLTSRSRASSVINSCPWRTRSPPWTLTCRTWPTPLLEIVGRRVPRVQRNQFLPLANTVAYLDTHLLHVAHHFAGNRRRRARAYRAGGFVARGPVLRGDRNYLHRHRWSLRLCGATRRFTSAGCQQKNGDGKK